MIDEIERLLDRYVAWLRDKTVLRQIDDWVEITTPHLDRHNDYLQIYMKRDNGEFVLSDDGYTIQDLRHSGCEIDTPKRKGILQQTLNGFGVQLVGDDLVVRASAANFPMRKHNLVQAMLAINDLFYVARTSVSSLFLEDVQQWLDANGVRFTENVKFTGKSGFDYLFDFVIPKSATQPERIVQAINRPDRAAAQALAFAWFDTRDARPSRSSAYALLNDENRLAAGVIDALRTYDVHPILWSRREHAITELAA